MANMNGIRNWGHISETENNKVIWAKTKHEDDKED